MRILLKPVLAALSCAMALSISAAQQADRQPGAALPGSETQSRKPRGTITPDDGLSVIAAALDPKVRRYAGHDCSHLVHAIYVRAGFPYTYASSDDLYDGVPEFRRVAEPQPGDLVVWHGHVGIVVRPSHKVFFSFMSIGPGVDTYDAKYWVSRGQPRFYRYLTNDACTRCSRLARRTHDDK